MEGSDAGEWPKAYFCTAIVGRWSSSGGSFSEKAASRADCEEGHEMRGGRAAAAVFFQLAREPFLGEALGNADLLYPRLENRQQQGDEP